MQAHFGADARKRLHQEVSGTHPEFDRAEGVLNSLSPHAHLLGIAIQPLLHRVDDCLMHPAPDTPLRAGADAADVVPIVIGFLADFGPRDRLLLGILQLHERLLC